MRKLLHKLVPLALQAGKIPLAQREKHLLERKSDGSPLSQADMQMHDFLCAGLREISPYPISSEEGQLAYEERRELDSYWLIDPLDGTKDFLAGLPGWTINIALLTRDSICEDSLHRPVLGLVYAPVLGELYLGAQGFGARRYVLGGGAWELDAGEILSGEGESRSKLLACDSVFHSSARTKSFLARYGLESKKLGSSLKFCALACGEADIYPRFNGSKEWDSAASQVILEQSGGAILSLETRKPLAYTKPSVENGYFIAFSKRQVGGDIWRDLLEGRIDSKRALQQESKQEE